MADGWSGFERDSPQYRQNRGLGPGRGTGQAACGAVFVNQRCQRALDIGAIGFGKRELRLNAVQDFVSHAAADIWK